MMPGKPVKDSQISVSQFMMPEHANHMGFVHGGVIMKLADETASLSAVRHAQHLVVTRAVDSMIFHSPVHVGEVLHLHASLTWVGRTSLEAGVRVIAENPMTGEQTHTNTAFFVYVAIDDEGHPAPVPPLIVETEEEQLRWQEAEDRRKMRRAQQK